jgi:hypothetical protein
MAGNLEKSSIASSEVAILQWGNYDSRKSGKQLIYSE